jgi:ribosomal protein S12 methylthiotransferase
MKVGIVSLGCPKNQVDSEVMAGLLKKAGHTLTPDEYQAEAIVVNTCSFITEAIEESIDTILDLSELKEKARLKYLIAAGCLAQRYKAGLVKELPEVDAYIGTGGFEAIAEVLSGLTRSKSKKEETVFPEPVYLYSHDTPRVRFTPRHWGYVKISDGCNNRCTYCMIPSIRGALRSRTAASVKAEAVMMAAQGVKEICLIAQDITAYGDDRKKGSGLTGLLKQLEGVKGIEWLRLLYTHPAHFTDELLDFLAKSRKVVRYLDIPMQHIDDEILKAMGRKIDSAGIRSLIKPDLPAAAGE